MSVITDYSQVPVVDLNHAAAAGNLSEISSAQYQYSASGLCSREVEWGKHIFQFGQICFAMSSGNGPC